MAILDDLYIDTQQSVKRLLKEQYKEGFYRTAFEIDKGFKVGTYMPHFDEVVLDKILSKPWTSDGLTFSDRIWAEQDKLVSVLHKELATTLIRGESPAKVTKAIQRQLDSSYYDAARLASTESAYFSSLGEHDCYEDLDVEKYQFVATLDSHTSVTCQHMDLKVFDMKEYQIGKNAPPMHPWCRSCTVPYFDDSFSLGQRVARDKDGKRIYVPSTMAYSTWKKTFIK